MSFDFQLIGNSVVKTFKAANFLISRFFRLVAGKMIHLFWLYPFFFLVGIGASVSTDNNRLSC